MNTRIRNIGFVMAGLAVIGLALGIVAFRLGVGSGASERPGDTPAAAEVQPEPVAADAGDEAPGLPREVLHRGYFVDQGSASSLETLVGASDIIAAGTIVSSELVSKPVLYEIPSECAQNPDWTPTPGNEGKGCPETMSGWLGEYMTEYVFRVDRYLRSDGTDAREATVRDAGGVVDGRELVISPFPLYETGQSYLLFLRWSSNKPNVLYTEAANLGGFELNNGQVDRLPEARDYHGGAPLLLEGLTEEDAVTLVKNVADAEVAGP